MYPVMRVHLSALLALVSATTYVACGSSNESLADQEGGAGGEGGAALGSGGAQSSTAGSQNSGGGTKNAGGGEGGEPSLGGMSTGSGGAEVGGEPGMTGGAGGEGGAGPNPYDDGFPSECPGVVSDYTLVDGTPDDDTVAVAQLVGKVLSHTFAGNDTFEATYDGNDCLVGGLGDDDFSATGETGSYLIGGSGADTFHVSGSSHSSIIVDLAAEDTIALNTLVYTYLGTAVGEPPPASNFEIVAEYEAGTGSAIAGAGVMIYDSSTGKLWVDYNGGTIGDGAETTIASVLNHATYTVTVDDFVLE